MAINSVAEEPSVASPALYSAILVVAFVLFSLNLRGPITAIPPLVGQIHSALGIGLVVAGMLTSIPIVCFGLLSPLASWVISRLGIHPCIVIMLVLASIGTLFRPYTGVVGMMAGTLVIGAALAMGNILGLMIIGHYFPQRASLMTGVFTSALNVGGMLFGSFSVPIAVITGWQCALASWVWLPVITLSVWLVLMKWPRSPVATIVAPGTHVNPPAAANSLFRKSNAWILSMAMSAHLFVYFSLTAWISAYMVDVAGASEQKAGLISGIYQAASVIGALLFPFIERRITLEKLLIVIGMLWFSVPLMLLVIPGYWQLWGVIGGANNGMAFVTVLILVMNKSQNAAERRRMSAMVQGIGFTIASIGPVALGYVRNEWHSWGYAWGILMVLSLIIPCAGLMLNHRVGKETQ